MEILKQKVKSEQLQNLFRLPSYFLDYDELEVTIMPISLERIKQAERDIGIINANAARFNQEIEENLLFQDALWKGANYTLFPLHQKMILKNKEFMLWAR